jgi:SAM-dependent methyltransferase
MPALTSPDLNALYDDKYHAARLEETAMSAAVVVPLLLDWFPSITSVVDVGCSTGAWLHEFQLHGIARVLGLDGADVPDRLLQIDPSDVQRVDLREPIPFLGRFDVALSLEVGDCLPSEAAQKFVTGLTRMSDVVVFSAAVPGQSANPTLNERWPSYWSTLFASERFTCCDILRAGLWYDQRVNWRYAQNMLVFVSESREDLLDRLSSARRASVLDIVHPRAFEQFRAEVTGHTNEQLRLFPFRLIEEAHQGFNILQIDVDKFLALAQDEGAYSPAKLAAGGYRRAYIGASADEAKAKITRARRASAPSAGEATAMSVEMGYRGFNILQIAPDKFLALAQSEGAYSPEKLAAGGYHHAYVAPSVKEARRAVRLALRERD